MMYRALLDHPDFAGPDVSSLCRVVSAMESMPDELIRRCVRDFGCDSGDVCWFGEDVRAAVAWLAAAFGFAERTRIGGSHRAQLNIGADGAVIVAERRGESPQAEVVTHVI